MSKFKMDPHTTVDKSFAIYNDKISLSVDYDDVDHKTVEREANRILTLLNATNPEHRPIGNRFHCFGDIIKNSNGEVLPADEPLFLIRGRDYLAIPMLERYKKVCAEDGGNDYILGLFDEIIAEFVKFSVANPDKMKQPGSTRGL